MLIYPFKDDTQDWENAVRAQYSQKESAPSLTQNATTTAEVASSTLEAPQQWHTDWVVSTFVQPKHPLLPKEVPTSKPTDTAQVTDKPQSTSELDTSVSQVEFAQNNHEFYEKYHSSSHSESSTTTTTGQVSDKPQSAPEPEKTADSAATAVAAVGVLSSMPSFSTIMKIFGAAALLLGLYKGYQALTARRVEIVQPEKKGLVEEKKKA